MCALTPALLLARASSLSFLLQAAAFGKSFLDAYNPSDFVEATRTLRVLNAVRDYKIGLPLTWDQ